MLLYDNNNGNAKTNKTFDFTGGLTHLNDRILAKKSLEIIKIYMLTNQVVFMTVVKNMHL